MFSVSACCVTFCPRSSPAVHRIGSVAEMAPITACLFLIAITVPKSTADHNMFKPERPHFPSDIWIGPADIRELCNDPKACNSVTLKINRTDRRIAGFPLDHLHEIHLIKRFELMLDSETCRHFISPEKHDFAAIRICEPKEGRTGTKEFTGTFFDADHARYDIMRKPGHEWHFITRVVLNKAKIIVDKGLQFESRSFDTKEDMLVLVANRAIGVNESKGSAELRSPIFGAFTHPTVELLIAVDQTMVNYFLANKNVIIKNVKMTAATENVITKYIGMLTVTADAIYSRMHVKVKLMGVRFLPKYKFSANQPRTFSEYSAQLNKFIFNSVLRKRENFYEHAWDKTTGGLPDATVTLTQAFPRDGLQGLAGPWDPVTGGYALVKCSHDALITSDLMHPHRLHHFLTAATIVHEIGHILQFHHPDRNVSECFTDHGNCIMSDSVFWTLPFWLQNETAFIGDSLKGSHAYLMQQNTKHADKPSVRLMSPSVRMLLWFAGVMSMIICVFTAYQFYSWMKMQPSAKYQRLPETEPGWKEV